MSNFRAAVEAILDRGGIKGYNTALREICRDLPHALGEIIYKVVRYHARRDPQDLVKVAAWAELEWNYANSKGSRTGNSAQPGFTWPADPRYVKGEFDTGAGMPGGVTGSARRGAPAEAFYTAETIRKLLEGRTYTGRRRSKPVGSKHRSRKDKR